MEGAVSLEKLLSSRPRRTEFDTRRNRLVYGRDYHRHQEETVVIVQLRSQVRVQKFLNTRGVSELNLPILHVRIGLQVEELGQAEQRCSGWVPMVGCRTVFLGQHKRSAQRTAVQLRPHQQTMRYQVAKNEPVVVHHGRQVERCRSRQGAAVCCNGLLGGASRGLAARRT